MHVYVAAEGACCSSVHIITTQSMRLVKNVQLVRRSLTAAYENKRYACVCVKMCGNVDVQHTLILKADANCSDKPLVGELQSARKSCRKIECIKITVKRSVARSTQIPSEC